MKPVNGYVQPLLTDFYQLTMAYAYHHSGKQDDHAVFDLFFRKNPFGGEFTIFGGLTEVLRFVDNFKFSDDDINYVSSVIPRCSDNFKNWLANIDCTKVKIYSVKEGNVIFPYVPMMRIEGPLGVCQLLETPFLNLTSYSSLITTNAARMRLAAGDDKTLVEFGLRRAQGPDGAVSAARYSFIGGFDGTSNVMAGRLFDIPLSGTQAHSYISSFSGLNELKNKTLKNKKNGRKQNFVERALHYRSELQFEDTKEGELAAFITYAQAFPDDLLALVDTYNTLKSGVPNFVSVALALNELGYTAVGIRLDSGDLAHLSKETRKLFQKISQQFQVNFQKLKIVASNELNEQTLLSLNQQGHEIDIFGVGTNLVTCQSQPALGCVYKLAEVNNQPRIKLSQDSGKITIPGKKNAFRLYGREGYPLVDLMMLTDEDAPKEGRRILCCHPYDETRRTYVTPTAVQPLYSNVWDGKITEEQPDLREIQKYVKGQLKKMREDHLRNLNPTPYKISVSEKLNNFMQQLLKKEASVGEIV